MMYTLLGPLQVIFSEFLPRPTAKAKISAVPPIQFERVGVSLCMIIEYGNCIDLLRVLMFYSCEKSISTKNLVLLIARFPSLVLLRTAIMLQHFIIRFMFYWMSSQVIYGSLKTRKFETVSSKWPQSL